MGAGGEFGLTECVSDEDRDAWYDDHSTTFEHNHHSQIVVDDGIQTHVQDNTYMIINKGDQKGGICLPASGSGIFWSTVYW